MVGRLSVLSKNIDRFGGIFEDMQVVGGRDDGLAGACESVQHVY